MAQEDTQMNPGKAGPKGALEEAPAKDKPPSSGPPGNEGNNTIRDFVQLPKHKSHDERSEPS
jgi:hypothetical protein